MKKIILSRETFIWVQGGDILLYNGDSGTYVLKKNAPQEILALCKELQIPDNLYCRQFNDSDSVIDSFADEIVAAGLGKKVDHNEKFITYPPILSIQNDISRIKSDKNVKISHFLHSFTIYTGGYDVRNDYGYQTTYPIRSEVILPVSDISRFIETHIVDTISRIKILLSNKNIGYVQEIIYSLKDYKDLIEFHLEYSEDIHSIVSLIEQYSISNVIYVPLDSYDDIFAIKSFIEEHTKAHPTIKFIVQSERDCSNAEKVSNDTGYPDIGLIPVYKDNLEFFKKNILLSEAEILNSRLDRRKIFIHKSININEWGDLSVLPDRTVRTGPGSVVIGSTKDPVYNLIVNAMDSGDWLKTRKDGKCANCLYNCLCPSISRFEKFLPGKTACNFK